MIQPATPDPSIFNWRTIHGKPGCLLLTATKLIQAPTSPPSGNNAKCTSASSPFCIEDQTTQPTTTLYGFSFSFFPPTTLSLSPHKTP